MSLPSSLNYHDENLLLPESLLLSPDLLFLYSLRETDGLSDHSLTLDSRTLVNQTTFENFNLTVDFEKENYKKIKKESNEMVEGKTGDIVGGVRNTMEEFWVRAAVQMGTAVTEKIFNPFCLSAEFNGNYGQIKDIALSQFVFDKLPGVNPSKWPNDLDLLLEKLEALPPLALFNEPLEYHDVFFSKGLTFIREIVSLINKTEDPIKLNELAENLINASKAIFLIYILSGNLINLLKMLEIIKEISNSLKSSHIFLNKISFFLLPQLSQLRCLSESSPKLHYLRSLCDCGAFRIAKTAHFQKQTFGTSSLANDSQYLYLYVSANNGGMYKIGTGEGGTIAGKVYVFNAISKQEEICWVYCKGKLYLRSTCRDFGNIEIICPNTFKTEGFLQLYCPEIFSHPSLQIINRNYPLLSDGEFLYIIGKKLISEKLDLESENKEKTENKEKEKVEMNEKLESKLEEEVKEKEILKVEEEQKAEGEKQFDDFEEKFLLEHFNQMKEDAAESLDKQKNQEVAKLFNSMLKLKHQEKLPLKKRERLDKKNKEVKPEPEDNTLKLCEFVLYEFDLDSTSGKGLSICVDKENSENKELIQELYESFSGYFSYSEIARALFINKDDISSAAQWLVDEGEKERTKKTIVVKSQTLLAQSEVISDISNKNLKNNAEIITREDSLVFPNNVAGNIWTMNKDQITLYSELGIKIFSKNSKDVKLLSESISEANFGQELQMFKPSTFSSINADFFKRNKELIIEESEILEKILDKDHFMLKYNRYLKFHEEKPDEIFPEDGILGKFASSFSPSSHPPVLKHLDSKSKRRIPLKGTFIKTIDVSKKGGFYLNPNYHITYDNERKLFYIMNWSCNSYTNVFPSLFTVSYDYSEYEEKAIHQPLREIKQIKASYISTLENEKGSETINFNDVWEVLNEMIVRMILLQKKRFFQPWKLNSWEFTYGNAIVDILNIKSQFSDNNKKDNEDEKKRINSQKTKLMNRLNKYLNHTRNSLSDNTSFTKLNEIKKVYSHCIEGDFQTLKVIFALSCELLNGEWTTFSNKQMENLFLMMQLLLLWVKHSDILARYNNEVGIFDKIESRFCFILQNPEEYYKIEEISIVRKLKNLIWIILIQGWEHFVYSTEKQLKWIEIIFKYARFFKKEFKNDSDEPEREILDEFGYEPIEYFNAKFSKLSSFNLSNYPLKESCVNQYKDDEKLIKVDNLTNFYNYFRKQRAAKLSETSFVEPFGRILNIDLSYLYHVKAYIHHFEDLYPSYFVEENIKLKKSAPKKSNPDFNEKEFDEKMKSHESNSKDFWTKIEDNLISSFDSNENFGVMYWRVFIKLFLEAWVDLSKIEDGFYEATYVGKLYRRTSDLMVRVLDYASFKMKEIFEKDGNYAQVIVKKITFMVNLMGMLAIQSNMMKFGTYDELLVESQIKLIGILKKITDGMDNSKNVLNELVYGSSEGIDQTSMKVFETNHPYERGKVSSFDPIYYPGALAICVEFDKRCQSDTTNDYLVVAGWYNYHTANMGLQMSPRDGVGTCYRISGKPNVKRPLVLLGNSLQVEFSSSGHAKDELSLNRWGFKINVKPIYGVKLKIFSPQNPLSEYPNLLSIFGSEAHLLEWIQGLRILTLSTSNLIEKYLRGDRVHIKEMENSSFLKWGLFRKGLNISNDVPKLENTFFGELEQDSISFAHDENDSENIPKLKTLLKNNNELQTEFEEDKYLSLKKELLSRIQKDRLISSEPIQIKSTLASNEKTFEVLIKELLSQFSNNNLLCQPLEEIVSQKGIFFDIITQIKKFSPEPFNYQREKKRESFLPEYKKQWEAVENSIILALLHHNGAIKIGISGETQYFKKLFTPISKKKNEILEWMLNQVQNEKEWQFALKELDEIKSANKKPDVLPKCETPKPKNTKRKKPEEEKKTLEIKEEEVKQDNTKNEVDEKLERDLWNSFQKRYEGNATSIKSLCSLKSIEFNPDDPNSSLKEFYNVTLETLNQTSNLKLESPYEIVAKEMIKKVIFLLKLNINLGYKATDLKIEEKLQASPTSPPKPTPNVNLDDNILPPIGINRSISCQVEEKIDREKLESFREWIDSYQKWKIWQHKEENGEEDLQSLNCSTNKLIFSFLCSKSNVDDIEFCLKRNDNRCLQRILGFDLMIKAFKTVEKTVVEKYLLGSFVNYFRFDCLAYVKCSSLQFKESFLSPFFRIAKILIESFNSKFEDVEKINLTRIICEINRIKAGIKVNDFNTNIREYLKLCYINIAEVNTLFTNKLPWNDQKDWEKWLEVDNFGNDFLKNSLELALLCKSLSLISSTYEEFSYLIVNIPQIVNLTFTRVFESVVDLNDLACLTDIFFNLIEKEFGYSKNSVNIRLLSRLIDLTGILRLEFLMSLLFDFLSFHESKLQYKGLFIEILQKRSSVLFTLAYFLNHPGLIRLIFRILRILVEYVDLNDSKTAFDMTYFTKLAINYDEVTKNSKLQCPSKFTSPLMMCKELSYEKPMSQYPLSNMCILLEKIGQNTLLQVDTQNLKFSINQELSKLCKDSEYSKVQVQTLIQSVSISNISEGLEKMEGPLTRNSSSSSSLASTTKQVEKKQRETIVLLQLNSEEDLSFLVTVLYYWESLYPSFSLKHPKTVEEYLKNKEDKIRRENEQKNFGTYPQNIAEKGGSGMINQNQNFISKLQEKIFTNMPEFNVIEENEESLPIAWHLNYLGLFNDMKVSKSENKRGKNKKSVKKVWANANLLRLEKKYDNLLKTLEEFKETDSEEDKLQIIMAKNFIAKMIIHIREVKAIAVLMNVYGYSPIATAMSQKKAQELGYIIQLGINGLLKPINRDYFKEELKKKLDPNEKPPVNPPPQPAPQNPKPTTAKSTIIESTKSQIVITLCDCSIFQNFDTMLEFVNSLSTTKDSFYVDCNKMSILHRSARSGSSTCSLVQEIIYFLRDYINSNNTNKDLFARFLNQMLENLSKEERWSNLSQYDKNICAGIGNVIGGWTQSIRCGGVVGLKNQNKESLATVIQGGYTSGKKNCVILSNNDPGLILQNVRTEDLETKVKVEWKEAPINSRILLESIRCIYNLYKSYKKSGFSEDFSNIACILRALLQISLTLKWTSIVSGSEIAPETISILVTILHELCKNCPTDRSFQAHEGSFSLSWEKLIDKLDPSNQLFSIPSNFENNKTYDFELEPKKLFSAKSSENRQIEGVGSENFVLPDSGYSHCLPEERKSLSEHKMLKYWEKHIIPKIQDFVRGSLKPWEFEDFFEQLRQPLRKGDQAQAAEVAYILCDQRLPAGVILPDVNHDWQTISIEEVQIGQWAIAKITGSNNMLYSPFFFHQKLLNNSDVCVQLLAVDSKSSSVLVLFQDHENLQLISVWLPVTCVKHPEIPLSPHVSSKTYEKLGEEFQNSLINNVALLSRQVLLRFFSISGEDLINESKFLKQFNLPLIEIIKWSILEELNEDPVEGWLEAYDLSSNVDIFNEEKIMNHGKLNLPYIIQSKRKNTYPKLLEIETFIKWSCLNEKRDFNPIKGLIDWTNNTFPKVCDFISSTSTPMNLVRSTYENNNLPFLLNAFENEVIPECDNISALCVSFKADASLCLCSGIKFFNDESGINIIHHIQAGKETRFNLKPILFKTASVWCNYYFNAEALPPYQQEKATSYLPAIISGIPSAWSVCCWLIDCLGTAFIESNRKDVKDILIEINRTLMISLDKMKGPHTMREVLARLMIRNTRRLKRVLYRSHESGETKDLPSFCEMMGITEDFLKKLISEIKKLIEKEPLDLNHLVSSYHQEIIELLITLTLPSSSQNNIFKLNLENLPDPLPHISNLSIIFNYIRGEGELPYELQREVMDAIQITSSFENVIYIDNLPVEWSGEFLKSMITPLIERHKGRILIPSLDFYTPQPGVALILLDNWAALDIIEVLEDNIKENNNESNSINNNEENANNNNNNNIGEEKISETQIWICEVCTLENGDDLDVCGICEAPRPPKKAVEVAVEEKRTDLSEVEKEIHRKIREGFEKIVEDIEKEVKIYREKKKEEEERKKKEEISKTVDKIDEKVNSVIEDAKKKRKEKRNLEKMEKQKLEKEKQERKEQKKIAKKLKKKGKILPQQELPPPLISEQQIEQAIEQEKSVSIPPLLPVNINLDKIQKVDKQDEEIDQPKSPEFSKEESQNKCLILFGSSINENKKAMSVVNEAFSMRLLNKEGTAFKNCFLKIFKQIHDIIIKEGPFSEKITKIINGLDVSSFESMVSQLLDKTTKTSKSLEVWNFLASFGFDYWGVKVCYHEKEKPNILSIKMLTELMKYIEIELCQETKSILTYSPLSIRQMNKPPLNEESSTEKPINYNTELAVENKYFLLSRYALSDIRFSWSLLKVLNSNLLKSIHYLKMTTNDLIYENIWLSLSDYISALRDLWMLPIRLELTHRVLQKTALTRDEVPKITLERLKMNKEGSGNKLFSKDGVSIKNKDDFIFTKSFDQLKEMPTTLLRPIKPQGAEPHISFEVIFKGENVMGEAGPYRQYFADISSELQASSIKPASSTKNLHLLCPSPNNDAKLGRGRDKFVVNPSANSSYHLQLFEFLGILMGCSVRTGAHLTLDLPTIFWKQLVSQKIEFDDLEEVDESLKDIVNIIENYGKNQFEEAILENFSTILSNKKEVELKKGGAKIAVKFDNRMEYIYRVLQMRLKESELQIQAIKKGMIQIVPLPFLNCVSAKDLEIWVCGKSKVDIDLLKRHTRYSGGLTEDSSRVKYFWEVLYSLKENEKLRFVKFCWGQERLPANDEEFERCQIRFMLKPSSYSLGDPDSALPKADTCFFNLQISDYSSKEILKERLLLAINTDCDSMNAEDPINLDPNNNGDRGDSSDYQDEQEE